MLGEEEDAQELPTIVVPGIEVREKIDRFAARLSEKTKRDADEMMARVLTSSKRDMFLFVDASHHFYPYFLSKVSEYRNHPERRPLAKKDAKAGAGAGTAAAAEGGPDAAAEEKKKEMKREELLHRIEQDARRYLEDPFPSLYSLNLCQGTVQLSAMDMDLMSCTAQFTAKYGEAFIASMQSNMRRNNSFRFLVPEDVRHATFDGLVQSYRRILAAEDDATETRLESLQSAEYVLGTVCAEKVQYTTAEMARRKAALLTDDDLRRRLQWDHFKVVKAVTLSDLSLDGAPPVRLPPRPAASATSPSANECEEDTEKGDTFAELPTTAPTSIQPPGTRPVFQPVLLSSNLISSATYSKPGSGGGGVSATAAAAAVGSGGGSGSSVTYIRPPAPSAPAQEYIDDPTAMTFTVVENTDTSTTGGTTAAPPRPPVQRPGEGGGGTFKRRREDESEDDV